MNLYKISQDVNDDYDTWDSAIVCAENENEARKIHPRNYMYGETNSRLVEIDREWWTKVDSYDGWASRLEDVDVLLIGEAHPSIKKGVVLSSYNAG